MEDHDHHEKVVATPQENQVAGSRTPPGNEEDDEGGNGRKQDEVVGEQDGDVTPRLEGSLDVDEVLKTFGPEKVAEALGRLTCTGLGGTTILWTREVLMERRVTISTVAGLLFLGGSTLAAHDLWIVPEAFRPRGGASMGIELRVGEKFPKSMNAPGIESLPRLAVVSTEGEKAIEGARKAGKVVAASFVAPPGGTFAIVLEGKPRHIVLAAEKFREYLRHEGLSHIHDERVRLGEDKKEGRESYSRHAKALLRSGPGEGTATRATGLKLELVPGADPYDLPPGQALPVTALYEGKPLGGLELRFYRAGSQVHRARTSPEGTANLAFDKSGLWCVAFIHMERCSGCPDADWRSYFGTLTFELPGHDQ